MTDINVGQLSDMINNKLDINAGNASAQTSAGLDANGIRTVTETYVNGTSGYRTWSDGYCEQWGQISAGTVTSVISVLKTYEDMNFRVTVSPSSYGANFTSCIMAYPSSNNSFEWNSYNNSATTKIWKTSGYLEQGQY